MAEKTVLFSEEDTLFSLMETALNGEPSEKALAALHYFFGDNVDRELAYLRDLPSQVGLAPGFRGVICDSKSNLQTLIPEADYLVCEREEIDHELIKAGAGRLRLIQKFGSDYKNIDIDSAKAFGIPVAYLRRIARDRRNAKDGLRSEGPPRTKFNWGQVPNIQLVKGKKLGLVGFGENALETAKLAAGLGMKILYFQRRGPDAEKEKTVAARYVSSLPELVGEADFTSIHVPYNASTEKMFNMEILNGMKSTAFLISGSRGGIVDEKALFKVLKENHIAGAALDVYRWEPVPADCPLLELDNVLWTTHNGGGAGEFLLQENHDVLANLARVERGEKPEFLVELR